MKPPLFFAQTLLSRVNRGTARRIGGVGGKKLRGGHSSNLVAIGALSTVQTVCTSARVKCY